MQAGFDIFTKEQSKSIKGLFAIVVLLHHIYQKMDICQNMQFVDYFMRSLGYLGVSVFLFVSGYGLYKSMEVVKMSRNSTDGGGYKVLLHRVLPIFFINIFLIVIYSLFRYFMLGELDLNNCLRSIAFGGNTAANGWYLQAIMWFYLAFIIISQISFKRLLPVLSALILVYMAWCFFNGTHLWWYISSLAFPVGAIMSKYSYKWNKILRGKVLFSIAAALFIAFYLLHYFVVPSDRYISLIVFCCLPAYIVLFSLLVYLSSAWISYKSKVLDFLGHYYLEIYVLQGLIFIALRNNYWTLSNPWLFAIFSIIGTLLFAIIAKPIFTFIQTKTRKLVYA